MNSEVKEVDSIAITEVAANVGAVDSQVIPIARTVLSDLGATNNLTAEERDDLRRLEEKFSQGQRESIAALREIRERKLYRETHPTFDDYVERRWNHTRQWASQRITWLRRVELLEANGKDPYHFTPDDAQALGPLEEHPELFVEALEEAEGAAKLAGKKRTKSHLKDAVKRRTDYLSLLANLGVPDLTYEESRTLTHLGSSRQSKPNLVDEAKATAETEGRPLSDCLLEVCQSHHVLPTDNQLLSVARGIHTGRDEHQLFRMRATSRPLEHELFAHGFVVGDDKPLGHQLPSAAGVHTPCCVILVTKLLDETHARVYPRQ